MEEIDLKEIFNTFWIKKVEIILILILFLGIGYVYTEYKTPIYSSSITLGLVSVKDDNSTITTNDITLNSKLIATYNKLIRSSTVLKDVITNLNIETDEETLKKNVSVSSINNTELIGITVKNEDNNLAAKIANEIATVFKEKVNEMYSINNIKIISEASVEDKPSNINDKKDIAIFLGIGMFCAVRICYASKYVRYNNKNT